MKVLLIDADRLLTQTGFPNLALMKISAYHKAKGDSASFTESQPDKTYLSCVFSRNRAAALGMAKLYPNAQLHIGGSGINFDRLPDEIEHIMPDYALYGVDFSMGFTSRGCIRKCPFCIVPQKEGTIQDHAPLSEFFAPRFKKLVLLDNNFLISPKWKENLHQIISLRIKVNFCQGLDIRFVNRENARMLRKTEAYNWHFKKKRLHFAFDLMHEEDAVRTGVEKLLKAGFHPNRFMFYMLVGFNTTFEEDMHRYRVLRELRVDPYVMLYNDIDKPIDGDPQSRTLKDFERWINTWIHRRTPWEEYNPNYSYEQWRKKAER